MSDSQWGNASNSTSGYSGYTSDPYVGNSSDPYIGWGSSSNSAGSGVHPNSAWAPYSQPQSAVGQQGVTAPGYSYGAPMPNQPKVASWIFVIINLLPILIVNFATTIVVLAMQRSKAKEIGGAKLQNCTNALNWTLTFLTWCVVSVAVHLVTLFALTLDGPLTPGDPLYPIPMVTVGVLGLAHLAGGIMTLAFTIIGSKADSENRVFKAPLTIPFVR